MKNEEEGPQLGRVVNIYETRKACLEHINVLSLMKEIQD